MSTMGTMWAIDVMRWCVALLLICGAPMPIKAQELVPAPPAVQLIREAQITPEWIGPDRVEMAQWSPVALDHAWRRANWCRHSTATYKIVFEAASPIGEDQGLWIHRAGNRLRVWVNEHLASEWGRLEQADADYSNQSLYAHFPWHVLRPGSNTVLIQVAGDCRRYSGLSQVEIGPHVQLVSRWQRQNHGFTALTAAIVSVSALLSLGSAVFAWMTRQRQAVLFAIASGAWALRVGLWAMTDLPLPYGWWFFLIDVTFGLWMSLTCVLSLWLNGRDSYPSWLERLQWWSMGGLLAASLWTTWGGAPWVKAIGIDMLVLAGVGALGHVMVQTVRQPNGTNVALSAAGIPMLVLGLVDHWNVWLSPAADAYHRFYFTPLIVLFFIVAIALLMMQQFHRAMRTDLRYRASLEREVAQQRATLQAQHQREQVHARKEAVQTERERIVRDMHDGLGAQLVGLLSSVRHAPEAAHSLEPEIQLALEQLRATMDSLTSTETDLGTVLAQFRFHHEARLRRSGIQLRWRVSPLPLPPWEPAALWHMELMLREAFANILKHAHAHHLTVSAGCDAQGQCHLSIADDGVGFDPQHVTSGRGLRHLQERAQMLGLALHIDTQAGRGTRILWNWSQNWVPTPTSPT